MQDYGRKEKERLLKNENQEELAENVAGWLLFITLVFLSVHVIIVMWERL
jgi:hypothetical protein